jgi:hypothetical protein
VLSIVLVKEALMHLKPEQSVIRSSEQIFELYSPGKAVLIEIFACSGIMEVVATDEYKNFEADSPYDEILLEQTNYGGHYLIRSPAIYGEYFIKVSNRE